MAQLAASLAPGDTGVPVLSTRRALVFLATLLCVLLCVFLRRAFQIDDPLFIWAARHIQTHPLNPYGFQVSWYGASVPMAAVTKNPPLASYYIALTARLLGWTEPALHAGFFMAAIAASAYSRSRAEIVKHG